MAGMQNLLPKFVKQLSHTNGVIKFAGKKVSVFSADVFFFFHWSLTKRLSTVFEKQKTLIQILFRPETQTSPVLRYKRLSGSLLLLLPIFEEQFCSAHYKEKNILSH